MCDACYDPFCGGEICGALEPGDSGFGADNSSAQTTDSLSPRPDTPPTATDALALMDSQGTWSTSSVTYGFANSADDYPSSYSGYYEPSGFLPFSDVGEDIMRDAFDVWNATSALTLVETTDPANAVIRVGGSDVPYTAWAYSPGTWDANGDIWFGLDKSMFSLLVSDTEELYLGSYEYFVALHEIGHSLGLKHPHQDDPTLDTAYDSIEYTVMSYRSYVGGPTSNYSVEEWGYPQSVMMLDLLAIQELYGADYSVLSGNTTYTFDPDTGEMMIDGVSQGTPGANRIFRTLWDGAGTDLIDLSNYTTDLEIDLNAGEGHRP